MLHMKTCGFFGTGSSRIFLDFPALCTSQWKAPHPHTRGMRGISGGFQQFLVVIFASVCGVSDNTREKQRPGTVSGALAGISLLKQF